MKRQTTTIFGFMALITFLLASTQPVFARGGQGQGMGGNHQPHLKNHKSEQHHSYRYQHQSKQQTMKRSTEGRTDNQSFTQSRMRQQFRDPSRHLSPSVE
jgi:hypothetical protein